jgi:hypothetical protein
VSFERGEKYSLPIFCEITIRGERNDGTEDTVFEKMDSWDLVDEGVEIIKYKPAQIDAEVAVYTITDKQMLIGLLADIESGKIEQGDVAPASREGEEDTTVTIAQFVYNNVSYLYSTNELSVDDMKAFLDTLAPSPDTKDNNASVKVEGEYVELPSAKASMTEAKFSSIDEIEKVIGVDILESPDAYTGTKGMYQYYPGVKDGKLFSATIMNGAYAIGDLKNFRAEVDMDDLSSDPETSFERGNKYHSALCFEITIRGERDDGTDSTEYESDNWDLPEGVEIIKYKPAQIDAEVALYTLMMGEYMNGMDGWEGFVGVEPMAIAQFAYNNTSYIYMARVSIDDMKAFLDTLALGK